MIVQRLGDPVRVGVDGIARAQWDCLARRGMLHSECVSIDHLRLAPLAGVAKERRDGEEKALYVVAGRGSLRGEDSGDSGDGEVELNAGRLALLGASDEVSVHAGDEGLELLILTVLPSAVSELLPARAPELPADWRAEPWAR
jgi:hypothetical protein